MEKEKKLKEMKLALADYRKGLNDAIQIHITGEEINFAELKIAIRGLFDCCKDIIDILEEEK